MARCFVCDTKQFASPFSVRATGEEKKSFVTCAIKLLEWYGDDELPNANICSSADHERESKRAIMAA